MSFNHISSAPVLFVSLTRIFRLIQVTSKKSSAVPLLPDTPDIIFNVTSITLIHFDSIQGQPGRKVSVVATRKE